MTSVVRTPSWEGRRVDTRRVLVVIGAIALMAVLWVAYVYVVAPGTGGFYAYPARVPGLVWCVAAAVLALVPSLWMPLEAGRPSQVLYWFLYVMVHIPTCIVPLLTLRIPPSSILLLPASILAILGVLALIYQAPLLRVPAPALSTRQYLVLIFGVSLLLYIPVVRGFGFSFDLPSWFDVYDVRDDYREALARHGVFVSIAVRWLMYAVNPLLIALGLTRRHPLLLAAGVVGELFIFAISGFKSALMMLAVVVTFLVLLKPGRLGFAVRLVWGATLFILAATVIDLVTHNGVLSFALTRRVFVVPALLTGYYFEFYLENGYMLFSHMDTISKVFDITPRYALTQPFQIGLAYFGNPDASANANLFADGFSNLGMLGIGLFGAIMALVFYTYDSIARTRGYWLPRVLLAGPLVVITNSALVALLVGHGFILIMILCALLPPDLFAPSTRADV